MSFSGSKNKEMIQNNYKTSKYIIKKIDKETIEEASNAVLWKKFLPYFTCKISVDSKKQN